MRNCFYPLLLSLLVCISCTTGHEYEGSEIFVLDDFVETRQLKGQTLEFDSLIMNPSDLMVIDSFLLVVDSYDEKQIHLYNLNTKKKIAARIFSGQGPKDMIQPMFVDNDKNELQLFDMAISRLFRYDLQTFVCKETPDFIQRIKLPKRP